MAIYSATTQGEVALSAATTRTLIQLRSATTVRPRILTWCISFDGTSPGNDPITVRLLRQATDGTFTAASRFSWDPVDPTSQVTAHHSATGTEPTASDVLESHLIHPQGGLLLREYPPGREPILDDATTSRIAIDCNAPQTVNAVAWFVWEE